MTFPSRLCAMQNFTHNAKGGGALSKNNGKRTKNAMRQMCERPIKSAYFLEIGCGNQPV